ncbi:major facilitator superfamily domain-containing protein [Phlebopus sp. FC_14]|nr:major facilitator superfamily domain-containing protein [Phlebopus sp. FC_14]
MDPPTTFRDTSVDSQTNYPPEAISREILLDEQPIEAGQYDQDETTPFGTQDPLITDQEEEENHLDEVTSWKRLPWWKRPSPYWIIFGVPLSSIGYSASLAPRVEMYTMLACRIHRPEAVSDDLSQLLARQWSHDVALTPAGMPAVHHPNHDDTSVGSSSVFLPNVTYPFLVEREDPEMRQRCAADPVVQAVAARLAAVLATTMGVLSCLVTAWWGTFSDRFGRRPVLTISMIGLFITDITFIVTAFFVDVLPGGYWFLLVGFALEGLCGGMSAGVAANHAYMADTAEPATRSRLFSLFLGFMFTGVALGPIIGGILIRVTGSTLSVFYLATVLHSLYAILCILVLPESLTRARARATRLRHKKHSAGRENLSRTLRVVKSTANFIRPLTVLLPEVTVDGNPLKRPRRDWSLFLIAISYGLISSFLGSLTYKFQYAAATFGWTAEIISYYISSVGAVRALFLAILLPLILKYLKPASPAPKAPESPSEPLRGSLGFSPPRSHSRSRSPQPHRNPLPSHTPAFDLALVRISLVLDVISFGLMGVASSGSLFTFGTMIGSFAAGFSPAAQALALEIYGNRGKGRGEVGKLFGALSVMQSLGSQILGPAMYGFVYFKTVAIFPQAIMLVSVLMTCFVFVLMSFVRAPPEPGISLGEEEEGQNEEVEVSVISVNQEGTA